MLECLANGPLFKAIGIWLAISGIVGFFATGIDKDRAVHGERRVQEKVLVVIALVGGSFGTALGSELFHHKTSKPSFFIVLYAIVGAWLFVLQRIGFLGCLITIISPG